MPQKSHLVEKRKLLVPNAQHQKLIDKCFTRVVEGIDDMSVFEEQLVSACYSLHKMKENKCETQINNKTLVKADSY